MCTQNPHFEKYILRRARPGACMHNWTSKCWPSRLHHNLIPIWPWRIFSSLLPLCTCVQFTKAYEQDCGSNNCNKHNSSLGDKWNNKSKKDQVFAEVRIDSIPQSPLANTAVIATPPLAAHLVLLLSMWQIETLLVWAISGVGGEVSFSFFSFSMVETMIKYSWDEKNFSINIPTLKNFSMINI